MSSARQHVDRIAAALEQGSAAARSALLASWSRSFGAHGLDPARSRARGRLDEARIRRRQEAMGAVLPLAIPRLEDLHRLTGGAALLCDRDGIVLARRCAAGDVRDFAAHGIADGADWSEAAQGTNGIGTCLVEMRETLIHRDQHFLAANIGMSCMDAPIFGPDGALLGALDVSSVRPDLSEDTARMIGALVVQAARRIEAEAFRAAHPGCRMVMAPGGEDGALFAVDLSDIVIGATRAARRAAGLPAQGPIQPAPAADLLWRADPAAAAGATPAADLESAERAALLRALARAEGNVSAAARGLGIGRATLYRRMKKLGIRESDL